MKAEKVESHGAVAGQVERSVRPRAAEALEARKTKDRIPFEQWLAGLDHAALTAGFRCRMVAGTGAECWRDYYDDGYTPRDALAEDLSHAA